MKVTKHGKKYNELHQVFELDCEKCECEFTVERYEFVEQPFVKNLTEDRINRYENEGKEALVGCPECGNIVKCKIPLTEKDKNFLEEERELHNRWNVW